ncbi:MAG: DNA-binding protein WhiA [Synergistaceae bacterium]|nr:DNA-binding protein WhiA [Synergistaceae bacterium]
MRLWGECEWNGPAEGEGIRLIHTQQRGRIVFSIGRRAATEIFAVTNAMAKRTRNWNWVRGLFGRCGALYIPRAGYYLVIRPPAGKGSAERVQAILKSCGFTVGVRKKMECRELMLRDRQQIVTFLSRIGLVKTALDLEETAIYRSMMSHANKLVNCDAANINKSLEAARLQMELIRQMEDLGIVEELPAPLFELVMARKKNPSITLKELGQTLPRPISKSTVEYRWRKLETMLRKQSKGDDANVLRKGRR